MLMSIAVHSPDWSASLLWR